MRFNRPTVAIFSCASLLFGFLPCMAQQYASKPIPPAGLSYAVRDIVKLSHAGISETVILNYVETSGTLYDLKPAEVIYLRDEGVTDSVINVMIDQRRKFQTNAPPPAAPEPVVQQQPVVDYSAFPCPLNCNLCASPLVTCRGPISTLHIIPYSSTRLTYSYYNSYQNWGSYQYYGPWRQPYGPRFYRCGHWHECSHWH